MALVRYEPMNLIKRMQKDMNEFFRQNGDRGLPSLFDEESLWATDWNPQVDIKEEDKQYVVTADIPGVDPKDIEVTMQGGVLTIRGERKSEKEDKKKDYRLMECSYGSFERSFRLPDDADADKVNAKGRNGVLTITIARKPGAGPKTIKIES